MEPGGSLKNISPGTVYLTLVLQETVLVLQQGCFVLDCTSSPGLPPPSKNHERSERSHQKRQHRLKDQSQDNCQRNRSHQRK